MDQSDIRFKAFIRFVLDAIKEFRDEPDNREESSEARKDNREPAKGFGR